MSDESQPSDGGGLRAAELRPLSLGEILDRTAQLYRSHFLLFVGIAVFPRALLLAWQLLHILITHSLNSHHLRTTVFVVCSTVFSYVLYFAFVGIGVAASNRAVSALYLGEPASIAGSYQQIWRHWKRYVGVIFLSALYAWGPTAVPYGAIIWVGAMQKTAGVAHTAGTPGGAAGILLLGIAGLLFFLTMPYGVWMMMRLALSVPASIFEGLGVRASLRRSAVLTRKGRGRIFVMALMVGLIFWTIFLAAEMPFLISIYKAAKYHHQAPMLSLMGAQVISFFLISVIGPIYGIAITLFYYDERIRKEGFDIEWMMQRANLGRAVEGAMAPMVSNNMLPPGASLG